MKTLLCLVCLAACCAPDLPQPAPAAVDPPPAASAVEPLRNPRIQSVVQAYRAVEKLEIPAITAPHVTADFVHRLRAADAEARRALNRLVRRDGHATLSDLNRARSAVHAVADVLDQLPMTAPETTQP